MEEPNTTASLTAVKMLAETDDTLTVGGYGVVWGGRDLVGEHFEKGITDFWFDRISETPMVMYNHGRDGALKRTVVGRVTTKNEDDTGLWIEAQITAATKYRNAIKELVSKGLLGWSSGSIQHLVEKTADGALLSWPVAEWSLVTGPCEPRCLGIQELKALVEHADALKALIPADEPETKAEEAATPTAGDTTAPVVAEAIAPAASEVEATEPAVTEIPTVDPVTEQAPAAVAAVDLNTNPDATANAIKALTDQVAALTAKLNDEPAVKAGGIALPELMFRQDATPEMKAFELYYRHGIISGPLKAVDANGNLKAALNEGSLSQGGYAVPTVYSNELIVPLTNLSYLRRAGARIMTFAGTNAVDVPSLTYTSAAIQTAEANAYSEIEPTLGHVTFTPYKFTRIAKASEELAADSRFDLWGQILMPDFAQAFAAAENTAFTGGTGSSTPQGLVYATSTGVTSASATAITADEVIQTFFALDYKYRDNAKWMMADSTVSYVRRLKDGQGNYLWNPGLNGSTSGELLGKEIVTNNSMDAIAASKDVICFFNPFYFVIGVWPGLSMQRLNELYSASGQLGWRSFARFDSHLMLAAGSTKLTTHS